LLFAGDLTSEQQPEETYRCELLSQIDFARARHDPTFRERLLATGGLGENFLAFRDL
jgi:hypothetical protein